MGFWDGRTHEENQSLASELSRYRPFVGRTVKVIEGKKHCGEIGVVFWHGADKFGAPLRYCDDYTRAMASAMGRYGFRIGVQTEDGAKFFVKADSVMVACE
ncbi:MAG: hypothetical protein WC236_13685 [Gallionellaceae bacterium]